LHPAKSHSRHSLVGSARSLSVKSLALPRLSRTAAKATLTSSLTATLSAGAALTAPKATLSGLTRLSTLSACAALTSKAILTGLTWLSALTTALSTLATALTATLSTSAALTTSKATLTGLSGLTGLPAPSTSAALTATLASKATLSGLSRSWIKLAAASKSARPIRSAWTHLPSRTHHSTTLDEATECACFLRSDSGLYALPSPFHPLAEIFSQLLHLLDVVGWGR
jgi:hypothetical protein